MVLLQYLLGLVLSLVPAGWAMSAFRRKGGPEPRFYFSGRVAIYRLARSLRREAAVAILPDYICNVLHRAFADAGFEIATYKTNDLFEPFFDDIRDLTEQIGNPVVLCLAPIMGADGGQKWITSSEGRAWRSRNHVTLMFDCCQDITRLFSPDFDGERKYAIVSSFNDKSFAGVMGAVTVSDVDDPEFRPATALESISIGWLLLLRCLLIFVRPIKKVFGSKLALIESGTAGVVSAKYEYSYCNRFPYTLSHSGATGIQVGVGWAGLCCMSWYRRKKQSYIEGKILEPVKTPYYMSAPYVVVTNGGGTITKVKLPYAIHDQPSQSLRPVVRAHHFKGFQDFA